MDPLPFVLTGFDRGHIVVPGVVDGKAVRLIFDSGGANYFTPASARRLGLSVGGGVNIGGVGENSESGGFARLAGIAIGDATLVNQAALVGPLPYPALRPRAGLVVDGLTGYEFLSEFRITIDYTAREMVFAPFSEVPPAGKTIPFFSDGHSIYVEGSIEGVSGLFRLDTGDGGALTVFRSFAERHGLFRTGGHVTRQAGGVGGAISAREVSGNFMLAGTGLRDVPISISDTSAGAFFSRTLAGNVGSAVLSRFTLTFDYRLRTLTLQPNVRIGANFERDRTGLSLNQSSPDAIKVLSVAPGSPAADAGLRAGDSIVSVDGRHVAADGLGIFDLTPLRFGVRRFDLGVVREGQSLDVSITPRDPTRSAGRLEP